MATARRVAVEITAQDRTGAAFSAVAQKFGGLQGQIDGLAGRFAGLQATVGAVLGGLGLGALVTGVADSLDAINDLSDATGASIANISRLDSAVRRTGGTFDEASALLLKFNQALNAAEAGSQQAKVFQALGLSVQELRRADPVQALLQTAQAFQRFGSSGDVARAQLDILGRSVGSLAPVLKDLAETGLGAAKVTDEQAAAADRYNKALARLKAQLTDATREIGSQVLPQLAEALVRLQKMDEVFGGIGSGVRALFFEDRIANAGDGVAKYTKRLEELRATRDRLARGGSFFDKLNAEAFDEEIRKLDKLVAYYRSVFAAVAPDLGQSDPAELARRGRKVPAAGSADFALPQVPVDTISEAEKYIRRLGEATIAALDLSKVEQARIDIATGKLGKLTRAQEEQILSLAEGLDLLKAPDPQIEQLADVERRRAAIEEEGRAIQALIASSRGAQFDNLVAQTEDVISRFAAGALSAEDYARAIEVLGEKFAALEPQAEQSLEKVSTFAEQASKNIQDTLGDTLTRALRGDFESIGDLWEDLIIRMVAQAAAAQLNSYLFGAAGLGGGGGVLGPVLGSIFGGFRAMGGPVQPGRAYVVGEKGPEIIVPSAAGTVLPNGAGMGGVSVTYGAVNIGANVSRPEVLQGLEAMRQRTLGDVRQLLARNGMPAT